MRDPVYLDHNATTTIRPAAADAVYDALTLTGNPSSVHSHGRMARRVMEDARDNIGNLVGANPTMFCLLGAEQNPIIWPFVEHWQRTFLYPQLNTHQL